MIINLINKTNTNRRDSTPVLFLEDTLLGEHKNSGLPFTGSAPSREVRTRGGVSAVHGNPIFLSLVLSCSKCFEDHNPCIMFNEIKYCPHMCHETLVSFSLIESVPETLQKGPFHYRNFLLILKWSPFRKDVAVRLLFIS